MKKLLFSLFLISGFTFLKAQESMPAMPQVAKDISIVKFSKEVHDFGTIPQNTPASFTFTFTNVGQKSITLDNVQTSCGCTTPNWKGGEYKPGESGQITATYNAASMGSGSKSVTVTTSEGQIFLTLKFNVVSKEEYDKWKVQQDSIEAARKEAERPKTKAEIKAAKKAAKEAEKKAKKEAKEKAKATKQEEKKKK